ncbi:MAG: hypothetical protein HKN61_04015, partial [Flavobacteriaceae bacterium]|nr:hypothetical protein [Flavobacteriaceae bacterium]
TYKLVAYTQWMKNAGISQIFQADIKVINPYNEISNASVSGIDDCGTAESPITDIASTRTNSPLVLEMDTTVYNPRSPVQLSTRNFKGNLGYGNYSLLVRRKNELPEPKYISATDFGYTYLRSAKNIPQQLGDSIYLPEQRGELIFGRVEKKTTSEPISGQEVILSLPGEAFQLTATLTNHEGYFYTYIKKPYQADRIIANVNEEDDAQVKILGQSELDFRSLQFCDTRLERQDSAAVLQRSVHNQLENLFFSRKPDSVLTTEMPDPFDGGIVDTLRLEDYTRFSTLEETFIELLNYVGFRRGKDGVEYIRVLQDFEFYDEEYNDYPALVLIDGVFIKDHAFLKKFDAKTVEEIRILRDQLVLGNNNYQGLIFIKTIDGDFYKQQQAIAHSSNLNSPRWNKRYFRPDHTYNTWEHIPDYRYVVFWEPDITINGTREQFNFFTSDIPGDYEAILEGFTEYGKPISLSIPFKVVIP